MIQTGDTWINPKHVEGQYSYRLFIGEQYKQDEFYFGFARLGTATANRKELENYIKAEGLVLEARRDRPTKEQLLEMV